MTPLRFCFDFLSPYAWIAWSQVHALAERHGREVEPVPILLAALLSHWGHKGPAEIPPKRVYVYKDSVRTASLLGLPLVPPPSHPFNPLLALRIASAPRLPGEQRRVVDALFRAVWAGGPGVAEAGTVREVLDAAGFDGAALVAEGSSEAAKARVKAATQAALDAGVFGVPTVFADGELFWGYDAFPHLERFLRAEDPVRNEDLERWADLPASSRRT